MYTITTICLLLHFMCCWTTVTGASRTIPIQFDKDGSSADDQRPTPTPALSTVDQRKNDSTGSTTAAKAWSPRDGGGNGPVIEIISLFPPNNATLDAAMQEKLTISLQIRALDVKRVRLFFGSTGGEMARSMTRTEAGSYALAFANMPPGIYVWRLDVIIDNGEERTTRSFGPWQFTLQGDSTPSPDSSTVAPGTSPNGTQVTAGLQSDCLTVDPINYNICLDLKSVSGKYETWMEDFGTAKRRWESILMDDGQSAVNLDPHWKVSRDWIATSLPPLVDDIYISGFLEPYDGKGEVLGMAGPYFMRTDAKGFKRPIAGYMFFDSADEAWLRRDGIWTNTIIHEMGHVLGLGTMWRQNGLHTGSVNDDVYRANSNAQAAWELLCPGGRLPIETYDASKGIEYGTAGAHWDEDCLVSELMTGFVGEVMPLSNITIASLADMGYSVDYTKADPFGREDLGQCGDYCPDLQRRRLRGTISKGQRRFRREVSANGHKKILQAAARQMQKFRSTKPTSLPRDLEYLAGERLTVFILDEDGDLKDETVSWEEAKVYAPTAV